MILLFTRLPKSNSNVLILVVYCLTILLIPYKGSTQDTVDVLIVNGKIITGMGNPWYTGNIAIKNGKICAYPSTGDSITALRTINASGLIVAPGFIDVHTHIEGDEMVNPQAANFIYDGVTTVVTGNCGGSKTDVKQYFSTLDSLRLSINVATLVGHNSIRKAVMGSANRPPTPAELDKMKKMVEQAMLNGAAGISTGLIYIPGTYAKTPEVVALASVAAQYHGIYASHIRNEGDSVTQAINEAIAVGRDAVMPVEISHFKLSGQQNWGRSKETLELVKAARNNGIDVTIDQYPYTASSTSLSTLLPDSILADGYDSIKARLAKPSIRNKVKAFLVQRLRVRKLAHFDFAVVAYYEPNLAYNGKSIEQVNQLMGRRHTAADEAETIVTMMEKGGAQMVFHGMSDDDVAYFMQYPYNMFASDASIRIFGQGNPHPRGYGTNARVLAKYVRDEKLLTLEEAIRRMTSLPAQKFNLKGRGILAPGYAADIVIFDEKTVQDLSTYNNPHQYTAGFKYVLVNGVVTLDKGEHNGVRNGQTLRANQ